MVAVNCRYEGLVDEEELLLFVDFCRLADRILSCGGLRMNGTAALKLAHVSRKKPRKTGDFSQEFNRRISIVRVD
jgi:hypothetical protein